MERGLIDQKQGLLNYAHTIKPIMLRMEGKTKNTVLNPQETNVIVQFYLEVVDYLSKEE